MSRSSTPDLPRDGTSPRPRRGRALAVATAAVFAVSSVFPVAAGLSKDTGAFPKWWGAADVGIASLLAVQVIVVQSLFQSGVDRRVERASYRAYRVLIHLPFVLLVVFFVAGDRVVWPNGLTGITWRAWLLLYMLPAWLAAYGVGEPVS